MAPRTRAPWRAISVAALTCGALIASTLVGSAAVAAPETASASTPANGYRNVGYFAQWGIYGLNYKVKDLQTSGAAAKLTALNYAFGNIHNETLTCFEANKAQGSGVNGSDGAGDAFADYGQSYTAATSVDGVADVWNAPLAGSFNQLKKLKVLNPDLKPLISLGGWTWSKNFSAAAKTDASRKKLVSSCIDLYIKGNLPVIDGRGGAGVAAGIFEGIDIDWEWPGRNSGIAGNGVDTVNDANNFRLLLKEFRTQLDAYGATTGKDYTLSAFLPANPLDIKAGGWNDPEIFDYLDYGNIQGYDLYGAWDGTKVGHQGNLYADPTDTRNPADRFSVDASITEYTKTGIDPAQLGMGMAMYGRGWQGVSSSTPWSPANGAAPGTNGWGMSNYDDIKNLGTGYYDAVSGSAYRHDGNQWWSYDNAQSIAAKAKYIVDKGLGGAMWWDLSGNRDGSLLTALATGLSGAAGPVVTPTPGPTPTPTPTPTPVPTPVPTPTPAPTVPPVVTPTPTPTTPPVVTPTPTPTAPPVTTPGACVPAAWSATTVYTTGLTASYNGNIYKAKWYTKGDKPGASDPWQFVSTCSGGAAPITAWSATTIYLVGDKAIYNGKTYTAKWWVKGDVPGIKYGAWAE